MKMKKVLIGMLAIFVSVIAKAADPTVDRVMVQQRWPWSRLVDIDYVLTCEPDQLMDIGIKAYNGSALLELPLSSLSGDLFSVSWGARRIVWDPTMTAYTNNGVVPDFRVALTPTSVPLYMIVDLTKTAGEARQTEYVYESDLTNGLWGAWARNPVTNDEVVIQSVVWTGVTTNDTYKTDKLVLRRISKGAYKMGGSLSTTLTKDFYTGVFQVTQRQWELIMGEGTKPSNFNNAEYYMTRPVEMVSYNDVRGATDSVPAVNWPGTGSAVLPASFVGLLRAQTGLMDFDLPTEAQWEYLCRAGTTTVFNDGDALADVSGASAVTNTWLDALGRYKFNGGFIGGVTEPGVGCTPTNGTAVVGFYQPNAWGLYDTHGNVMELCLDWQVSKLVGGSDPAGPESGSSRMQRGGGWRNVPTYCSSAYRLGIGPSSRANGLGFRLVRTLP
ncbi:MAG: formylglycine-generating enzyme family protein [Kiritimatiellia bacterium]